MNKLFRVETVMVTYVAHQEAGDAAEYVDSNLDLNDFSYVTKSSTREVTEVSDHERNFVVAEVGNNSSDPDFDASTTAAGWLLINKALA